MTGDCTSLDCTSLDHTSLDHHSLDHHSLDHHSLDHHSLDHTSLDHLARPHGSTMTLLPDFDAYPVHSTIDHVTNDASWVEVIWSDGHVSRFHHIWLRDNCPCEQCVHQSTKEQTFEVVTVSPDLRAASVDVTASGALGITWTEGGHRSELHSGWLRAHCYSAEARRGRATAITPWDSSMWAEPPTFDGPSVLTDDEALEDWLQALVDHGATRLRDLPCADYIVGRVAARIGIVRETNFGVLWDVRSDPDPISNANTALPLPPHVDLPTREYQPGVQFLHCIENRAEGGDSVLVDGFRIAQVMRDEHPDDYELATTVPWTWANRSRSSDYRWRSPLLVTDRAGEVVEVRAGNWLRAPLDLPFEQVKPAYSAYRRFFELTYRDDLQVRFRLEPGDLIAFDNRRVLHGRSAFTEGGTRSLRGCYLDRDELTSRLRLLGRARRTLEVADADRADADHRG